MTICGAIFVLWLVADFFGMKEGPTFWQGFWLVAGHLFERIWK